LDHLAKICSLVDIQLEKANISDEGVKKLVDLPLKQFNVNYCTTISDDALASHVRSCRSSLGGTEAAGASVAERLHPPRARLSPRTPPARLAFYNDVSGWVPAGGVDFSPTVNFKIYNPLAYR